MFKGYYIEGTPPGHKKLGQIDFFWILIGNFAFFSMFWSLGYWYYRGPMGYIWSTIPNHTYNQCLRVTTG